jgi:membrane associated rhomboid family serine protease
MWNVSSNPPEHPGPAVEESEQVYCYAHRDIQTRLHCSRCDRPICGRCAIPATVGQHCPECVAEARKSAPKVRSALAATAPAVMAIIGINVAVYLAQRVIPGLTLQFAMVPAAVAEGQWWRLLSAMFLHAPGFIFHILFNMYVLYIYGPLVEQAFGTARFVALYVISGFVASAASFALGPQNVYGVGASGAIFGVVGILLVYTYNRRTSAFIGQYLRNLLIFIGINLAFGFFATGIDNRAHIGGLIAGVLLGAGFDRAREGRASAGAQAATALAVTTVGLGLVLLRSGALG